MSFQYSALAPDEIRILQVLRLERPPEDRNLRLLDVLPFRERDLDQFSRIKEELIDSTPLKCVLKPIPLDGKRCFEAISHTWGDPTPSCEIILNDKKFLIPERAYHGLLAHRIRRKGGCQHGIWLDTICINQQDDEEKSVQVQLMGEIYSAACEVTVWLGPEEGNSNLAMDFLPYLYEALCYEDLSILNNYGRVNLILERTRTRIDSPEWVALLRIFDRPWFERIWIVQEIALARFAWVVCGDRQCEWSLVAQTTYWLGELQLYSLLLYGELSKQIPIGLTAIRQIELIKNSATDPKRGDLMIRFASWKATDLKDKVYALLGLSSDAKELNISPNYSLKHQQVWASACRAILLQEQDFEILGLAGRGHKGTTRTLGLPSWVPDLASPSSSAPLSYNASRHGYKASGDTKATIEFTQSGRMIVHGIVVDKVKKVGRGATTNNMIMAEEGNFAPVHSWIEEMMSMAINDCESEGRKIQMEDFWRSLVGNVTDNGKPVPEWYENYFISYRKYQSLLSAFMKSNEIDDTVANMKNFIQQREELGMDSELINEAERFQFALCGQVQQRRFCITEEGRYGFVPERTGGEFGRSIGEDCIYIVAGSPVPWVIRRPNSWNGGNVFEAGWLLGEAYVLGLMSGEGLEGKEMEILAIE